MPSQEPLPSIPELLRAFESGLRGERNENRDARSGSLYNLLGGVGALVFYRLATRDRDTFRGLYFDFADGDGLSHIAEERFKDPVITAARGSGTVYLRRVSTSGGAGTFWKGTRITLFGTTVALPHTYLVSEDTLAGATDTYVPVSIVSEATGRGSAIDTLSVPKVLSRFDDPIWDNSWTVERLLCQEGTDQEKPEVSRARIRTNRFNRRVGYPKKITDACVAAGAVEVALFPSDFLASNPTSQIETIGGLDQDGYGDVGLNYIAVGDGSFQTSDALRRSCQLALKTWGVAGTAVQVVKMQPVVVTLTATVKLWDNIGRFATSVKQRDGKSAILNYFDTRQNPFYFRLAALRGSILRAVGDVQSIDLATSYTVANVVHTTEPPLTGILKSFPVARYQVSSESVTVQVTGP